MRRRPTAVLLNGGPASFDHAGHFTWDDAPERYWPLLLESAARAPSSAGRQPRERLGARCGTLSPPCAATRPRTQGPMP